MPTRFTFPPVNLAVAVEPQLANRAEWCGYKLIRMDDGKSAMRWKLKRGDETFILGSLCEVDMKLGAILEQIGERVEREQVERMRAERVVVREAEVALKVVK